MPNNIFYNTGITTFVWLLTNNKAANRRGKVQLIDASQAFEKLRKNQGQRNCTITPKDIKDITGTYIDFIEREADEDVRVTSKIFDNDDFRYHSVTVERPLRLRCQFNDEAIDNLLFDGSQFDVSTWLYGKYGELVFDGLEAHRTAIKEALQDQDIKLTDKKLDALIAKKKWIERQQLREAAVLLRQAIGNEVYMDFNVFFEKIKETARVLKKAGQLDLGATQLQTIARAMSMPDPAAAPVIDKEIKANAKDLTKFMMTYDINEDQLANYGYDLTERGTYITYESDSALRDTEKIPVKEDILAFFKREVVPYVPDAWINLPATKIGCEISFNKYFYRPVPLRSLEENTADILALEKESEPFSHCLTCLTSK